MKSDINGKSQCQKGCEQYETFTRRGRNFVQYDYRTRSGELFTCVAKSLSDAREKRDYFLKQAGSH